jgi:uncharacterized protein YndB with AHSA1/START domain
MPTIRRQISIATTPRGVWNALVTPAGLQLWLADDARVDARQGGRVSLAVRADGGRNEEQGFLHVWRPTAKLEIGWDARSPGPFKGTFTQFSVARDGSETVLNVVHEGPSLDEPSLHASVDALWKRALLALRDGLEGGKA